MNTLRLILAVICILGGLFFVVSAVVGNFKFRFVLSRMHAAGMADTMGVFFVLLGLVLLAGWSFTSLKMLLVLAALWLTSPVASHLVMRMTLSTDAEEEKEEML